MKYYLFLFIFILAFSSRSNAQTDTSTQIERSCPSVFTIKKNDKVFALRYASNHPITEPNKKIKRLIIYVHGARRNGLDYYEWGEQAVKNANQDETTLFISPQFPSEKDLNAHNHDATHLFWANNSWRSGDESATSKKRTMAETVSSFSVVDSMIAQVCNKNVFPKLKKIIVIGHSAGGQFLQRYAGMTPMPEILRGYQFRFIVMNASSYLYFDERRPVKTATGLSFVKPDTTGCSDFNTYPKGFVKPNSYLTKVGTEKLMQQFLTRDIVFIMGGNDVDANDTSLDKSCSGLMQGRFRLERGQFFYEYVKLFGKKGKFHHLDVVPNVAHSGEKMVNNTITSWYLFNK